MKGEIKKFSLPFTQISNVILNDAGLSLKAKGLYAYLFSKPDGWVFHNAVILREIKEGRDAFRTAVLELENAGYIKRETLKNSAGQVEGVNIRFINPSEIPLSEKPTEEKPKAENPKAENPAHIKKDLNNINLNKTDGTPLNHLYIYDGFHFDFTNKYIAVLKNEPPEQVEAFRRWLIDTMNGERVQMTALPRLYLTFKTLNRRENMAQ